MPELPEVEITARLLGEAIRGKTMKKVRVQGLSTLRSFDPPVSSIEGAQLSNIARRGKHLVIGFSNDISLLVHLMSAGRLQLFDKTASLKDKTTRLVMTTEDGHELRLREFGTKQSAWAKLMATAAVDEEPALSSMGPEAWPDPPDLKPLFKEPRPLHSILRDQRVIAGIGRSWVDEILHAAMLSPFKRASKLSDDEAATLREKMIDVLGAAIAHYEKTLSIPIPDKLPMPLQIHRHQTEPCWRCGTTIEAVFYEDHVMCYCPKCQTDGKVLKDRRLSRLLK
jgi:formamidopyrimidine-DNA glycosylase